MKISDSTSYICRDEAKRPKVYRISSYSFRGNYSFLTLALNMYCDLWSQYINVRKLFKGGNYSRAETIWGNTVVLATNCWKHVLHSFIYAYKSYNICQHFSQIHWSNIYHSKFREKFHSLGFKILTWVLNWFYNHETNSILAQIYWKEDERQNVLCFW